MNYYILYKNGQEWFTEGPMDSVDAAQEYINLTDAALDEVVIVYQHMDHTISILSIEELVEG